MNSKHCDGCNKGFTKGCHTHCNGWNKASHKAVIPIVRQMAGSEWPTMRFGNIAKVLAKCKLEYHSISECRHSILIRQLPAWRLAMVAGICTCVSRQHAAWQMGSAEQCMAGRGGGRSREGDFQLVDSEQNGAPDVDHSSLSRAEGADSLGWWGQRSSSGSLGRPHFQRPLHC